MSVTKLVAVPHQSPIVPLASKNWFTRARDGSVEFHGDTFDDHVAAWGDAQNTIDGGLWGQAIVAASLERKYGERGVKDFAASVGRSMTWIYDMARAYRVFQFSSQLENLSFTHHVEAAKAAKDESDPTPAIEALAKAHEGHWNTKELQEFVEHGVVPEPKVKRKQAADRAVAAEMAKLHDEAVRNELSEKISVVGNWPDKAVDPVLAAVYRRIRSMLEWQRDRTVETDCAAIMEIFAGEEGMELPDRVSKSYISAWLNLRGRLITASDLNDRIETLKTLQILTDHSRKKSKGEIQRGAVPPVYAPCEAYLSFLEDVAFMPSAADRKDAIHKDWIERVMKYDPSLLPKEAAAA